MESRAHAVIAVAFLVLLGAGLALAAIWMHPPEQRGLIYDVISTYSVTGLQQDAPVRYKGVKVGEVRSIGFDPRNPRDVLIRISVALSTPITHSTYAELTPQGVTGLSYLSLNDEGEDHTPLPTSAAQPGRIPMHMSYMEAFARLGNSALKKVNAVADSLNSVLNEDNRRHIGATLRQLDEATRELVAVEKAMLPAARGLPQVIDQATRTLQQSQDLLRELNAVAKDAHAPVKEIGAAAKSVQVLGQSTADLASAIHYDTLPRINAMSRQLESAAQEMGELGQELRRQPQALLYGTQPPPPGPGEPGFRATGGGK